MEEVNQAQKKQFIEIKAMIQAGNIFEFAYVKKAGELEYSVYFTMKNGPKFEIHTQFRTDRCGGLKRYKTIDTAVRDIEKTGYKGYMIYII